MKCVGILIFVLLVQSVDKYFREKHDKRKDPRPTIPTPVIRSRHVPEDKKGSVDEFRSKLNTTHGILIPNDLLLTVPLSDISKNVLTSFHSLQETLSDVSGCESKNVSSVAVHLFELLNKSAKSIGSLSEDRSSIRDALPGIFLSITETIAILDIGTSISDGVAKIGTNLLDVIEVLDEAENSQSNITKKLNDAAFSLATSVHVVILAIAVIAESAAAKISTIATDAQEATVSLTLILHTTIVIVQSISSSIASTALSFPARIAPTSSVLNSYLVIVDRALTSMTNVLAPITLSSTTSSLSLIVSTITVILTSLGNRLNGAMEKLRTSVVLEIPNKLESILGDLIGSKADFASYITTSAAIITSSISAISSSDAGLQSKISRQLYPVFHGLSQLTGADYDIATNLADSLSVIFDVLKLASSSLLYGFGGDVTRGILKSIEDILGALQNMATGILTQDQIDSVGMDNIAMECAKTVQVFHSVVIAIVKTISGAISSVDVASLEAVISLQIIHSTVSYVVLWLTVVAASVFSTKEGIIHDLVSSLAAVVVVLLKHDADILEIIAASPTQSSSYIVSLIAPAVSAYEKTSTSLSQISKVNANINLRIDQISPGGNVIPVEGVISKAEGNLSQILSGLTGSLSSIPATFSSSLNSIKSSLHQITSSEFEILQKMSGALISIITDLSEITGSATQVLHLTSKSLYSIYGRLLETTSRLSSLGDLVTSLISLVANISSVLHSLLYAVNNYKVYANLLIDSFRDIAKTVQILISTFSAVVSSAASASNEVLSKVSVEIAALPYLVVSNILVVQQVVGASIPILSAITGTIESTHHTLIVSISSILEQLTSITGDVTHFVTDGNLVVIPSKIFESTSNLNNYTSAALSKISGVVANIQVTLGLAN